jgi:hypothetical protein
MLKIIYEFIDYAFLFGFSIYSFFFVLLYLRNYKRESLLEFDKYASSLIANLVIIYLVFLLIYIYKPKKIEFENDFISDRYFGPFWFITWINLLRIVILPQLLRSRKIRTSLVFRIFFAMLCVIPFEQFLFYISSLFNFHKDYLPSSWTIYTPFVAYITYPVIYLVIFVSICFLYKWILTRKSNKSDIQNQSG